MAEEGKPLEIYLDSVSNKGWIELLKDIKQFCSKEGIKYIKMSIVMVGKKRWTKLYFKEEDWSKVNSYLDKSLLGM